jgi:hypothetical protein
MEEVMETLSMIVCGIVLFVAIYGLMGMLIRPPSN